MPRATQQEATELLGISHGSIELYYAGLRRDDARPSRSRNLTREAEFEIPPISPTKADLRTSLDQRRSPTNDIYNQGATVAFLTGSPNPGCRFVDSIEMQLIV